MRIGAIAAALALSVLQTQPASPQSPLEGSWPTPIEANGLAGQAVTFPTRSPFVPEDIGRDGDDPPTTGIGTLFMPADASAAQPVPAVVLLHGSGGVIGARELTYGRQFAAMGVAALAVDAFAARRERGTSFTERLIQITETMLVSDAYAALRFLAARPEIDRRRVALVGFSYGGMATTYAVYAQVAERLAPDGLRFAGHAAYYAPCVARFEDHRTTGAPLLMLAGALDEIVDPARCAEVAADLRAGGSAVETIVYEGAYHQWDGAFGAPRRIGRNLADCRLEVERDGTVRDRRTMMPMVDPFTRRLILGLCTHGEGYLIGRDDAVRERSNRDLGRFLARVFGQP